MARREACEKTGLSEPCHRVEDLGHIGRDLLIGSEEAQILVVRGIRGVVVAGADVNVPSSAAALLPDQERQFGVHLEVGHPIDHVDTCPLEGPSRADVETFVETRLHLDKRHRLLVFLGGSDE